jgi:transcriptional regulator with PAS, ATPase and Fis domain
MNTIENKKEDIDPKKEYVMKQNQKVEETDSLNPPNCFRNGNDLLTKIQYINREQGETGSRLILQRIGKNLFIQQEKFKVLLVSQRMIEIKEKHGAKIKKKPSDEVVLEVYEKKKVEHYPVLTTSNEKKICRNIPSMHHSPEVQGTNFERKQNSEIKALPALT